MTERDVPASEDASGAAAGAEGTGTGTGGPNELTNPSTAQRDVRDVVGRRGYDEGEDETATEDEQH